jgi:excisionase family DNA binding protein
MLVSVREAGALLGVSTFTVRRLIAAGDLPAVRLGRRGNYRVRRVDLEALYADPA